MREGDSGSAEPMTPVPGDPDRVASLGEQLAVIAAGLDATASVMVRLGVDDWRGPAAEALLGVLGVTPVPIQRGGNAFGSAAEAVRAHARVLREAQAEARRALSAAAQAEVSTRLWERQRSRAATLAAYPGRASGVGAGQGRGQWAQGDPGAEARRAAQVRLSAARASVAASAARVAATLHAAAQSAPREPNLLKRVVTRTQQYRRQVALGVGESAFDLGRVLLKVNAGRLVTNPAGWWRDNAAMAGSLTQVFTDPVGFGKSVLDWNTWSRNPARAVGHLLPDLVAALAGGGAAAAARGGRLATDAARLGESAAGSGALELGERATAAGRAMRRFPEGEPIAAFAGRIPPRPGVYDVAVHGTPSSVLVPVAGNPQVAVSHRVLARLIRAQPDYDGEPVRLLSCCTGAREGGFAQDLANALGVRVEAPSDKLWISASGEMTIGPYDFAGTGEWRTFVPGGQRR